MDGLKIAVKTVDGSVDESFTLTPRMIVEFEQKFGKGFAKLLGEDQKFEHIYFLAWLALRTNGKGPKPFGLDFIDTLSDAELVTDPLPNPRRQPDLQRRFNRYQDRYFPVDLLDAPEGILESMTILLKQQDKARG